jgi:hypothetical protein
MFAPYHHVNIFDAMLYMIKNLKAIEHRIILTCELCKFVKVLVSLMNINLHKIL